MNTDAREIEEDGTSRKEAYFTLKKEMIILEPPESPSVCDILSESSGELLHSFETHMVAQINAVYMTKDDLSKISEHECEKSVSHIS